MGWTRHTGTVVSFAVLASVVANYAVHRHFERRQHRVASQQTAPVGALIFDVPAGSEPDSPIPRFLDEADLRQPDSAVMPALQTSDADEPSSTPKAVPVPNDAVPITEKDEPADAEEGKRDVLDRHAVRMVIEDELAGSSREERDIWYEELKSLPAGVVRDLLQVRKQLRALPRALHKMDPAEALPAPRVAEVPTEPASQTRRQTLPDWVPSTSALEQACAIARHNLANATTPGFKRLRVTVVDSYGTPWQSDTPEEEQAATVAGQIQVNGCRLGETLLDLNAGTLHNTGRQFDLALDGDGFFVARKNDKPVYTRCGAMVLDSQRRLCLVAGDGTAVIEPAITIPANAREVQVSGNGVVAALVKLGAEPVEVGRLVIAQFPSPSRLRLLGGTLLIPTEASGAAELDAPGEASRGTIQQGFLEQSNVEPEDELAEIEQWQSLLKSFPAVNRPFTASGQESRSR